MKETLRPKTNEESVPVYYTYKDRVFRLLFKDRERLLDDKAEVVAMSIYEYNEEYVRKSLYEDGQEEGYQQGHADGIILGKAEILVKSVESAMQNFEVDLEKACEGIGVTIEEYKEAKCNLENRC